MLRSRIRILFIEEDPNEQRILESFFKQYKNRYALTFADSVVSASDLLEKKHFDVIVSEINFIDGHIFDLLPKGKGVPFIIVTARGYEELAVMAIKRGVTEYIIRDIDGHYLEILPEAILRAALNKRNEMIIDIMMRVLQSLDECVCIIDSEGDLMFINKNFARLCEAGEDYYLKKIDLLLQHFNIVPLDNGPDLGDFLAAKGKDEGVFQVKDFKGVVVGVLRVIPVHKSPGEMLGYVLLGNCHAG